MPSLLRRKTTIRRNMTHVNIGLGRGSIGNLEMQNVAFVPRDCGHSQGTQTLPANKPFGCVIPLDALGLRLNEWTQVIITAFPILSPDSQFIATFSSFGFGGHDLQDHLAHFGYQILPAVSLCLLFWSSTIFTESITASKYPAYQAYQKRVAMFSPISTLLLRIVRPLIFGEDEKDLDRLIWNSEKME